MGRVTALTVRGVGPGAEALRARRDPQRLSGRTPPDGQVRRGRSRVPRQERAHGEGGRRAAGVEGPRTGCVDGGVQRRRRGRPHGARLVDGAPRASRALRDAARRARSSRPWRWPRPLSPTTSGSSPRRSAPPSARRSACGWCVGQGFRGDALPRNPAMIARFVLVTDAGEMPVAGRAADEPAGAVADRAAGPRPHRVPQPRKHGVARGREVRGLPEGGGPRVRDRGPREERRQPEAFARALLALGEVARRGRAAKAPAGFDRVLGLTLELVPEKNPYAMKAGDDAARAPPLRGQAARRSARGRARLRRPGGEDRAAHGTRAAAPRCGCRRKARGSSRRCTWCRSRATRTPTGAASGPR